MHRAAESAPMKRGAADKECLRHVMRTPADEAKAIFLSLTAGRTSANVSGHPLCSADRLRKRLIVALTC